MRRLIVLVVLSVGLVLAPSGGALLLLVRTLDGSSNNLRHPTWGRTNTEYLRVADAKYADGIATQVDGPSARYVSNRIFNDTSQNLFSENAVSQWGFVWGQFLDHTFGLRQEAGGESAPIGFSSDDPIESFTNDFGSIPFLRTPAAPGTGVTSTRQQLNTVSGYIDASAVYGDDQNRLEWLLEGPFDGRMSNSGPKLMLDEGYLPTQDIRGNTDAAPPMAADGRLAFQPGRAMVAGDVRANENAALTATHTLFAREHNRIVSLLPRKLPDEIRFQIARRVVGAEQQYITYNEFLPALGVNLSPYRGYDPGVNAALSNEFAVVGYRAHSMIHGELEPIGEAEDFGTEELEAIEANGVEVVVEGDEIEFVVPLNVAFFNPDLFRMIGIDAVMAGLGAEAQYKNDEQIDNQLRSVLFQVPVPGNPDCLDGPTLPKCFRGVVDLAAIDIQRGRDHGLPHYNELRQAYGLAPKPSFESITGESTSELPTGLGIDDPRILEFVELRDAAGNVIPPDSEEADEEAVVGIRRSTSAARLRALYGDVDELDSFVGMAAEQHVAGTEFGELQLAIWKKQFEALRDGDRFFYGTDPLLRLIEREYGITYKRTLGQVIELNTEAEVEANVFVTPQPSLRVRGRRRPPAALPRP
jgi:peroxidase